MAASKLLIRPQKTPLKGIISVPGDKSISHRAIMLGALAEGISTVRNWLPASDTIATLNAFQAMGVVIEVDRHSPTAWNLVIEGRGLHGLKDPRKALDCRNAGTLMRLIAGIMAGQNFSSVLDGSEQLRQRPMRRITEPLKQMKAKITSTNGTAPLSIEPSALKGVSYEMKVASGQVKSALLLAGLYAKGETRVYQPGPARDHTERMLSAVGVSVRTEGDWIILPGAVGERKLHAFDLTVPGDISSAAFPLVAATIVPHSEVTITNVGYNDTRTGILEILQQMGAKFVVSNQRVTGGEPSADVTFYFDELHSADIGGEVVVRGIDEFPILTVAATQAAGTTTVYDAAELRVKEVDRIGVLAGELAKMNVDMIERPDGYTLHGPKRPFSAKVDSHDDHRLAMALAVMGLVTYGETLIDNALCIHDSFPGFVKIMQSIGANMEWVEQEE